jgi:predicted nucleotidyltransferase
VAELGLHQKRLKYRQALEETYRQVVDRLSRMPEVEKVILFGSYAAGRRDLLTDLDLIVVMDTDQDILHRTASLVQNLQASVDLDLLIYTPEEFESRRESGFLRHALETGQVVYEKNSV